MGPNFPSTCGLCPYPDTANTHTAGPPGPTASKFVDFNQESKIFGKKIFRKFQKAKLEFASVGNYLHIIYNVFTTI